MITEFSVKNFTLLEDLRLEWGAGLTVLTGETGAGKSLLLDALGLALGRRSDAGQVRRGADRLAVCVRWEGIGRSVQALLAETGLADGADEGLLVRREVDASGKSKAFVNDRPVSLGTLARLGERLVFAHGQSEQQGLLRETEQRDLIDGYGRLEPLVAEVEQLYQHWKTCCEERDALALSEQERAQRLDLYRFQKKELDAASPATGEETELEGLLPQLKNADRLKSWAIQAAQSLHAQDASATELVRRARRDVESLRAGAAPMAEVADLLESAGVQLEEAAQRLESYASGLDVDPARLEMVLSRLDQLGKLKRKYGPTLDDVVAYRLRVTEELGRLENCEGRLADVTRRAEEAEQRWVDRARLLTEKRGASAKSFSTAVREELKEVGLPGARLRAEVTTDPLRRAPDGADRVRLMFCANPGEGESPLAQTASGGELSRVMLAIESVGAKRSEVPVLIFDEIDAGVGGATGGVLGKKLSALAQGRQVLCVTHLATIAACADDHWSVEKETSGERTRVHLQRLNAAQRAVEIARLFGSTEGSDREIGLKHARNLLAASREK